MPTNFSELDGHDAYEVLGIGPDASRQDVRLAYRALARAHHPDLFSERAEKEEAEKRIRLLNAARDVLTDHRSAYDAFRRADDVEDPTDHEIIDDPWDTAEAGVPPPRPAPAPGFSRPPPAPTWQPAGYRPAPPPPPRVWPQDSPMRLRDHQLRRPAGCALGCLVLLGAVFLPPALVSLFSSSGPRPSASVPGALSGTWKGTVTEKKKGKKASTWKIELTLHSGKHNGDVDYFDGKCTGTAVPVSYKAGRLTVSTDFPEEMKDCDTGDFELAPKHSSRVTITYRDGNGKTTASGVLTQA